MFKVAGSLVLAALLFSPQSYADNVSGVLVAAQNSQLNKISIIEVRKLYLGLPASKQSGIKQPVINTSDKQVYLSFMNNIMRMTEKSYNRKLIKRIFRQGADKIISIDNNEELVQFILDNPNNVTFMSIEKAKNAKGIKVVQPLW